MNGTRSVFHNKLDESEKSLEEQSNTCWKRTQVQILMKLMLMYLDYMSSGCLLDHSYIMNFKLFKMEVNNMFLNNYIQEMFVDQLYFKLLKHGMIV